MRNNLLDTHTFLWFLAGDEQLSKSAITYIEDPKTVNYISIASLWEIAIKLSLRKLRLNVSFENLKNAIVDNGFEILPLDFEHIINLTTLENYHKDPFNSIIISQAISENLTVISRDNNFELYQKIKVIW